MIVMGVLTTEGAVHPLQAQSRLLMPPVSACAMTKPADREPHAPRRPKPSPKERS